MAISAILELQLKADSLDTAHQLLHQTLTGTRARPGCLGVTVLIDDNDPAHVVLVETWESPEADQAYRAWRATPEGATELGSIVAGPPKMAKYTVADDV